VFCSKMFQTLQNKGPFMKKFMLYHFPALLCVLGIIVASSLPGTFIKKYISMVGSDKLVHAIVYAIFAALIFNSLLHIFQKMTCYHVALMTLGLVLVFSFLDELYQRRIPGRTSDVYDIIFDLLGAAVSVVLLSLVVSKYFRNY